MLTDEIYPEVLAFAAGHTVTIPMPIPAGSASVSRSRSAFAASLCFCSGGLVPVSVPAQSLGFGASRPHFLKYS